ncbi:MAG: hypothetical protein MZV70_08035 [Desulfobacterales bacterium]|nr:hypothetical protein [Desulfobacterales bacterium]
MCATPGAVCRRDDGAAVLDVRPGAGERSPIAWILRNRSRQREGARNVASVSRMVVSRCARRAHPAIGCGTWSRRTRQLRRQLGRWPRSIGPLSLPGHECGR